MNSRLVAVLACRNRGSRLYGKPLQRLSIEMGWRVLDQVVANLRRFDFIEEIVFAISAGSDNHAYIEFAENLSLPYVVGDEQDVLKRLLMGLDLANATDLFRVTTESPFLYWQPVEQAWTQHIANGFDATFMDGVIDGCGFEIISTPSLQKSWRDGDSRHRSELCSLYVRENRNLFSICQLPEPTLLSRKDLRLTVDYPEDLIVCRSVYSRFREQIDRGEYDLTDFVAFLDESPALKKLISPFAEQGYQIMYL